jgi:hypothetical protein
MMVDQDIYRLRNGLPLHAVCSTEG